MKKVFIVILLGCIFFSAQGQEKTNKQKLTRKEKKELRLIQEEKTKKYIDSLINTRRFILKATHLAGTINGPIAVSSSINFIKVDSNLTIFQFGSDSRQGRNGIGGYTTKGRITKFEISKNEKSGWHYVLLYIKTNTTYQVRINISPLGFAEAEINDRGYKLIYSGEISEIKIGAVFQGITY